MDLWYFFACQGIAILRKNAVECFIAPNNWISNFGAKKMREKVLNEVIIEQFIDFGDYKVFNTAGIQTMVYLLKKDIQNQKYLLKHGRFNLINPTSEQLSLFLNFMSKIHNLFSLDFSK
jgi:hypothetical protein